MTVAAKQNDATIFLVEVKQAGVYTLRNLSEVDAKRAISSVCPSVLFPYARAAVSQLVHTGWLPAVPASPVNFDALYASTQAQQPTTTN